MAHIHKIAEPGCGYCRRMFRRAVVEQAARQSRDLPWRDAGRSEFGLVVAEILLQQTHAEHVAASFHRILARVQGWEELATIPIDELEELLRPLGLQHRRARTLRSLATALTSGGCLPSRSSELAKLPGIGQYIARAIAVQLHGERTAPIDVNIARVLERVFGPRKLADLRDDPYLQRLATAIVPRARPAEYLLALLDFAGSICRARSPQCGSCPVPRCRYATEHGIK